MTESQGAPVATALVSLIADDGSAVATAITNLAGAFAVRAPKPGKYTVRVERIGFATFESAAFAVGVEDHQYGRIRVATAPVSLPQVEVDVEPRCSSTRELSAAGAVIWDEARKALAITGATSRSQDILYHIVETRRSLDPQGMFLERSTDSATVASDDGPFRSIPADSLVHAGFAQHATEGNGWAYFGPDAEVLMSEAFLSAYCFEAVRSDNASRIGLRFRPVSETPPGIEGTMWLTRADHALRTIEFDYVNIPYRGGRLRDTGGQLDFARVPGVGWTVTAWKILVPRIVRGRNVDIVRGYTEIERRAAYAILPDGRRFDFDR